METIKVIAEIVISLIAGSVAGLSTRYVFNRIPAKWLCDYNEEPSNEMWGERIKKQPWDIVFTLLFIAASLKLIYVGELYAIAGIVSLWLLLQIGIADKKYMIIPDQFVIALAATALGFIPFHTSYLSPLFGALIGGGSFLIMGIIGRLIFRQEAMGFGDVKLFAALGLVSGVKGVVIIMLATIFISAFVFAIGLLAGKVKKDEAQPLGPFIAASAAIYILFNQEIIKLVDIYFSLF